MIRWRKIGTCRRKLWIAMHFWPTPANPHGCLAAVLDRIADPAVARTASEAAVKEHPDKCIFPREQARMIRRLRIGPQTMRKKAPGGSSRR